MRVHSYKTGANKLIYRDDYRGSVRFIGRRHQAKLTQVTFDDSKKGRTVSVDFPDDLIHKLAASLDKSPDPVELPRFLHLRKKR